MTSTVPTSGSSSSLGGVQELQRLAARAKQDPKAMEAALREASTQFVSIFMNQMIQASRQSAYQSPFGRGGAGERFFQSKMDEEVGMSVARRDRSLTELIYRSLARRTGLETQGKGG